MLKERRLKDEKISASVGEEIQRIEKLINKERKRLESRITQIQTGLGINARSVTLVSNGSDSADEKKNINIDSQIKEEEKLELDVSKTLATSKSQLTTSHHETNTRPDKNITISDSKDKNKDDEPKPPAIRLS